MGKTYKDKDRDESRRSSGIDQPTLKEVFNARANKYGFQHEPTNDRAGLNRSSPARLKQKFLIHFRQS